MASSRQPEYNICLSEPKVFIAIRPRCCDGTSRSFFYYMVKIHSFLNTSFRQCLEYFIEIIGINNGAKRRVCLQVTFKAHGTLARYISNTRIHTVLQMYQYLILTYVLDN